MGVGKEHHQAPPLQTYNRSIINVLIEVVGLEQIYVTVIVIDVIQQLSTVLVAW